MRIARVHGIDLLLAAEPCGTHLLSQRFLLFFPSLSGQIDRLYLDHIERLRQVVSRTSTDAQRVLPGDRKYGKERRIARLKLGANLRVWFCKKETTRFVFQFQNCLFLFLFVCPEPVLTNGRVS